MRRFRIGIRWWLGLAFALVAAVTALAVASVFSNRSGEAFRGRAKELIAGSAFVASQDVNVELFLNRPLNRAVQRAADLHQLAIFVYDEKGKLVSPPVSRGVRAADLKLPRKSLAAVIERGDRFATPATEGGGGVVVGLPFGNGAMIAKGSRPELEAELGIVRSNIVEAALVAIGIGAVVGGIIATLISVRLRRIARTAAAIEQGNFDASLQPTFADELGDLASTVDRMRGRLRDSFTRLEFERDRLHDLLERLHEGVITVDASLTVQFANSEAVRVLGLPLEEGEPLPEPWQGFSLQEFVHSLFGPDAVATQARFAPDEERITVLIGVPGSSVDPAIVVVADLSEQQRREHAEREFVANASHELRTPLTTILGAVDALQSGAKEEPVQRDRFLGLIERESERLARLARALLVLARAQTREELPRRDLIRLRPLLEEVAAGVVVPPEVAVEVRCDAWVAALADRDLAEQVLRNLAENAAKNTRHGRIVLSAERHNGSVQIGVSDTGNGMSPETRDRIFDRFYRAGGRGDDGFGLGLAIVREAVRVLGGGIDLESAPNRGTTVTITLPGDARGAP